MTGEGHLGVLREACKRYLKNSGLAFLTDMEEDLVVPFGYGVQVFVMPRELPQGPTVVKVESLCVRGMRIDGDLGIFLAEENGKMLFGKLSLYPDRREVHFEHALLGDYLNRAELELAVQIAAASTSQYGDRITKTWGGRKGGEA